MVNMLSYECIKYIKTLNADVKVKQEIYEMWTIWGQ
jgi:hypothetical protein